MEEADPARELKKQVEAAFSYRGHVTVTLKDGVRVEGYLYNRVFDNPKMPEDNFIELIVKDSDARRRIPLAGIASVALTGKNHAETFAQYSERTGSSPSPLPPEEGG